MNLLSLIAAFLLEQLQPLSYRQVIEAPLERLADFVESRFNAGSYLQGVLAWLIVVVPAVVLMGLLYWALYSLNPLLAWLLNVGILYLTMGFRQFSHAYTEIHLALRLGDLPRARQQLAEWQGIALSDSLDSGDIARQAIEGALAASHRHVFAVLLWFVLLPGPCGALLYRLSAVLVARWRPREAGGDFFKFPQQVFGIIDWLPARATATAFAIVGDFEDAVYCWRNQAANHGMGIVLASGAGALGVQLGMPLVEGADLPDHSALGVGDPADVDFMQSAVGLVWRATVLWILLLFLLGLASLAG